MGAGGIFPNGFSTKNANFPDHGFRNGKFMLGGRVIVLTPRCGYARILFINQ